MTRDVYFVVSPEAFAEVEDEPLEDELSDLREFGVDDGNHGGVDVGKGGRSALSLEHRPRQQTSETQTHFLYTEIKVFFFKISVNKAFFTQVSKMLQAFKNVKYKTMN